PRQPAGDEPRFAAHTRAWHPEDREAGRPTHERGVPRSPAALNRCRVFQPVGAAEAANSSFPTTNFHVAINHGDKERASLQERLWPRAFVRSRCREKLAASAAPANSSGLTGRRRAYAREPETGKPRDCGAFHGASMRTHITSGSLNASGSSSAEPIGMQLQNTFLSPCTLSTRATGGQYFCWRNVASGNAASSRG